MSGSGTVLRQAADLGHCGVGFDMDPLAVLMTRVWTTPVDDDSVATVTKEVMNRIADVAAADAALPWMDNDQETKDFVDFWFAEPQKGDLRRIASVLDVMDREKADPEEKLVIDLLRISFSRLIITKDKGASLARDVSHSRPHRVCDSNDFDVLPMFARSIKAVRKRLTDAPPSGNTEVDLGDARQLNSVEDGSIDAVLTSPPYLNAIDYMRGHRLSLIWLGHKLSDLRIIRSTSIGAERAPDKPDDAEAYNSMRASMGEIDKLPRNFQAMIDRYVQDIKRMVDEISRVLKSGSEATFVMGNNCLRNVFICNSEAVATAARLSGLELVSKTERPLPVQNRYLPMTSTPLSKRMRTETILTFKCA